MQKEEGQKNKLRGKFLELASKKLYAGHNGIINNTVTGNNGIVWRRNDKSSSLPSCGRLYLLITFMTSFIIPHPVSDVNHLWRHGPCELQHGFPNVLFQRKTRYSDVLPLWTHEYVY